MPDVQLNPPRSFTQGSTLEFRIDESDYRPEDGWTGEFALISPDSASQFAAADNGDGTHLFTLTAAQTAALAPGLYRYQINVALAAVRHTVRSGVIEAVPNYATAVDGLDDRSHAAKVYDAVCDLLEGKFSNDQSSLAVGGRSLTRYTPAELLEVKGYYAHQMTDEERKARGFAPRGPRTVRFVR